MTETEDYTLDIVDCDTEQVSKRIRNEIEAGKQIGIPRNTMSNILMKNFYEVFYLGAAPHPDRAAPTEQAAPEFSEAVKDLIAYFPQFEYDYPKLLAKNIIQEFGDGLGWDFNKYNVTTFCTYFRERVRDKNKRLLRKTKDGKDKPLRLSREEKELLIEIFDPPSNYDQLSDLDKKGSISAPNYLDLIHELKN